MEVFGGVFDIRCIVWCLLGVLLGVLFYAMPLLCFMPCLSFVSVVIDFICACYCRFLILMAFVFLS